MGRDSSLGQRQIARFIEALLCLAIALVAFASMGGCQLFAAPKVIATCKIVNLPVDIAHKAEDGRGYIEESDDWWVHCTVTRGPKTIFSDDLALPHPTSYEAATEAAKNFVKVEAAKIANGKGEKPK